MKRSAKLYIALIALCAAMFGCNHSEEEYVYTCGNGILEADETCDGMLISPKAQVICTNGAVANLSRVMCTSNCTLDMSWACFPTCGNGIIEGNEQCDGASKPVVTAACDNPDMSKLQCRSCRLVDLGVCPNNQQGTGETQPGATWVPQTCGNNRLDEGELCDGTLIADNAKICPENMVLKSHPSFQCLDSCRLVDIRNACTYRTSAYCGNGIRENDEQCDGSDLNTTWLETLTCGQDETKDIDKASCTADCQLDVSAVCTPSVRDDVGVLISEVVPHFYTTLEMMSLDGMAFELTNMSNTPFDLSSCALALIAETGIQKKYALSSLGLSTLDPYQTTVVCSYDKDEDMFAGACNAHISSDGIQDNLTNIAYIGLVCGADDQIIDLFNYNSFKSAVQYGGVDFVRMCYAEPATDSQSALLGEAWMIDSSTTYAPAYGLGSHCENLDSGVTSCTYTMNRTTLENRGQTLELALEVKIPGQSDKTNKTDSNASTQIQFITGSLKDNKVKEEIIHLAPVRPDTEWTNNEGIDRYVGTLRNWDVYEGFLAAETGTYVLDATISFDSGKTRVFCGPKGIIKDYAAYNASERNTLTVSYDDNGGTCGDGIITASELCEGTTFRDVVYECENPGEAVVKPENVKCYSCTMVSTAQACDQKLASCGNNVTESPEICDGNHVSDALKTCPDGMVEKQNPIWTCQDSCMGVMTSNACENACGNGQLDTTIGEICDGTNFDHDAAAAACKSHTTYDKNRAACSASCQNEIAACVPNTHLAIDEFLVHMDAGKPNGVAFALKYSGSERLDVTHCTLSLIDADNKIIYTPGYAMAYFDFATMMQATETPVYLDPCKSFVVCSEPAATEAEYQNVFGGACDAHLTLVDTTSAEMNPFIEYADKIAHLQLTCGGEYIDFFDYSGLNAAMNGGITHGKLKSADTHPWPNRQTVKLEKRMDLDEEYSLSSFAADTCK